MSDLAGQVEATNTKGTVHDAELANRTSLTVVSEPHRTWSNGLPIIKVMLAHHLDHAA